eukprot:2159688-Pyramimonas_sp.AAC.1
MASNVLLLTVVMVPTVVEEMFLFRGLSILIVGLATSCVIRFAAVVFLPPGRRPARRRVERAAMTTMRCPRPLEVRTVVRHPMPLFVQASPRLALPRLPPSVPQRRLS